MTKDIFRDFVNGPELGEHLSDQERETVQRDEFLPNPDEFKGRTYKGIPVEKLDDQDPRLQ